MEYYKTTEFDGTQQNIMTDDMFKNRYFNALIAHFNGTCPFCGKPLYNAQCDHFFIPKRMGGYLMMRSLSGDIIMNALPLCDGCNKQKGARIVEPNNGMDHIVAMLLKFEEIHGLSSPESIKRRRDKLAATNQTLGAIFTESEKYQKFLQKMQKHEVELGRFKEVINFIYGLICLFMIPNVWYWGYSLLSFARPELIFAYTMVVIIVPIVLYKVLITKIIDWKSRRQLRELIFGNK